MTQEHMTEQEQQPAMFTSPEEMKQISRTRPIELIKGFVPSSGVVVLAGAPGTGKSFTALSWAAAIAEGGQWFGHTARQAPVVYVLGEGFSGFGSRVEAWETVNGRPMPEGLWFVDGLAHGVDLKESESVQELIEALAWVEPGLVIFDTFSMLARVSNENDNAEVATVMANINKIVTATGSTAMLIHHLTKTSRTVRGASAFVGNADTVVIAAEDERDDPPGDFYLSTETKHGGKQRDGEAKTLYGLSISSPGVVTYQSNSGNYCPDPNVEESKQKAVALAMAVNERMKEN